MAVHLISPGCSQQRDPLQFIKDTTHLLRCRQQQEVLHIQDAGGLIGPFDQASKAAEQPGLIATERHIGDAVEELATAADAAQLFLIGLLPESLSVLDIPIKIVEVFPHLCGDHIANLSGVFTGTGDATHDAVGVVAIQQQKADDVPWRALGIGRVKPLAVPIGIHQGKPGLGAAGGTVQGHGFAHFQKPGNVFGPLDVPVDPVQRIGHTAQHGTSSWLPAVTALSLTTQVSLQPPPWEEFTTREPRFRATRVKPPGLTQSLLPLST